MSAIGHGVAPMVPDLTFICSVPGTSLAFFRDTAGVGGLDRRRASGFRCAARRDALAMRITADAGDLFGAVRMNRSREYGAMVIPRPEYGLVSHRAGSNGTASP